MYKLQQKLAPNVVVLVKKYKVSKSRVEYMSALWKDVPIFFLYQADGLPKGERIRLQQQ